MRNLLVFLFGVCSWHSYAQSNSSGQKIGHADWEYIFSQLPEYQQIANELRSYDAQLQNQLKLRGQELDAKYKSYQGLPAETPEAIRKDKESELTYLQQNIQRFQEEARLSIEKKQNELVSTVFSKVGKAIDEVAKEHGYTYIMNPQMVGGGDVLLFADEKYNISDLVLKKLGIVPNPAGTKKD